MTALVQPCYKMRIIDEDGRLFETVNIVDALVVFLVLAVGIAGLALVTGGSSPTTTTETRTVTLDLDTNQEYIVEQIDVGDTAPFENQAGNMTITDLYVSPTESGLQTTVRVRIIQRTSGDSVTIDGKPLRVGQQFPFESESYALNATVREVGGRFNITSADVLVKSTVTAETASKIDVGDTYRLAGQSIATVENVTAYGTTNPNKKRVYVGLTVQTLGFGESRQFGTIPVREGSMLPFRTNAYNFVGEITRLDALQQPGEKKTRTVTLAMKNVPPSRANSVEEGLTETNAGQTIARVTDVEQDPAVMTIISDDGNIYKRDHPVNKTVTLTADLTVHERNFGTVFKGNLLQEGAEITLALGTTTINASVVDLNAGERDT